MENREAARFDADFIIPANDRSKKSVDLILETIKKELTAKS